jgi:hypothetical protein
VFLDVVVSDLLVARAEICLGAQDCLLAECSFRWLVLSAEGNGDSVSLGRSKRQSTLCARFAEIGFFPDCISYSTIINELQSFSDIQFSFIQKKCMPSNLILFFFLHFLHSVYLSVWESMIITLAVHACPWHIRRKQFANWRLELCLCFQS